MAEHDAQPGAAGQAFRPAAFTAVRILDCLRDDPSRVLVYLSLSGRQADAIVRALRALAPDTDALFYPAWDCLPYDFAPPSCDIMGRRAGILRRLTQTHPDQRVIVTTPPAILQRVPPGEVWSDASLLLRAGAEIDLDRLKRFLQRTGYIIDTRVDEPGEVAIRGSAIDIYPAAAASPFRLEHDEHHVAGIRSYDAVTQRTIEELDSLLLEPASELIVSEAEADDERLTRFPGIEHWLPELYPRLEILFDYLPDAALMIEPEAEARRSALLEQIADAYDTRARLRAERQAGNGPRLPVRPEALYVTDEEWQALIARRPTVPLDSGPAPQPVPRFVVEPSPARALAGDVKNRLKAGQRVVLTAASQRDSNTLARYCKTCLGHLPEAARDWNAVVAAREPSLLSLRLDIEAGCYLPDRNVAFIAAADVLGTRADGGGERVATPGDLTLGEPELGIGDAVIHLDHGMAALRGLETVTTGETSVVDAIRLEYAGETKLTVPADELDRIWRYGSQAESVRLDRLGGESWPKRRAKVENDLRHTVSRLYDLAQARTAVTAPKLIPPRGAYERFAARFPFAETPDQDKAIRATLADLASGRPMDRLVCGDVGFGKTEVALRAAAAVAFAGRQVAVIAPTTVLARQHCETFNRRFAGLGIEVAHLSRLVDPAEARAVKEGLASGRVRVVIGTHALAGKGIRFADLALLVIDEEQRFGTREKDKLRALGRNVHVLSLTATPIPRTLQSALIGIQDLSIIATPPARRQPIRTFVMSWDPATLREALLREKRRGGQSFVVCPRIEDIEPMRARLVDAVSELDVTVAHGRMQPDAIDSAMLAFAEGHGDVLLATNIIESGLDLPRANTIVIWRADRFGLAQLHQLRGRVGRGRVRGTAYLLTDPDTTMNGKTDERLRTLQALDRLGAGFAISARDLDLRGAGDLFGNEQAGHIKLIGVGLYQHLFERALRQADGERLEDDWSPELNFGAAGAIPEDYVPEPELRINLYARLARLREADSIEALAGEIEDRFGPLPDPVQQLLEVATTRRLCRSLGVAGIDAGPQGIALTFRAGTNKAAIRRFSRACAAERKGERLVIARPCSDLVEQRRVAIELIERLTECAADSRTERRIPAAKAACSAKRSRGLQ